MSSGINVIGALIVIGYLMAMTGVGLYFARRQRSLDDFFRASQSMTWQAVGLSLIGALNSGIDYLMQPASTIKYGLVLLVGSSSWLFLYPWVCNVTLPFYRRLGVYTAYEFLEARFDVRVRTLAAAIFIVWRLGWMATSIYVPCLAIDAATNGSLNITTMIVVVGVLVTIYTMLGGIEAVIWNDVIQFCVMFSGLAATVWISLSHVPGGLSEIWTATGQAGHAAAAAAPAVQDSGMLGSVHQFFAQPINAVAVFCAILFGRMAAYTGDQVMVQRFQTTRSLDDSRRAYIVNAAGDVIWMFGLSFVGLALLAYFNHNPPPADLAPDKVLPYFISRAFPAAAVGLVIAAILSASLASIASAINACTSVMMIDGYGRLLRRRDAVHGGTADVFVSRVLTALFGAAGTILATNVSRIGTLLEIAQKLINAFSGPLFGIFILAMFSRRATSGPALIAGIVGSLTSYYVAYHSGIGFMWPSTFGLAATIGVGWVLARLTPSRPSAAALKLTWREVMESDPRMEVEHVRNLR